VILHICIWSVRRLIVVYVVITNECVGISCLQTKRIRCAMCDVRCAMTIRLPPQPSASVSLREITRPFRYFPTSFPAGFHSHLSLSCLLKIRFCYSAFQRKTVKNPATWTSILDPNPKTIFFSGLHLFTAVLLCPTHRYSDVAVVHRLCVPVCIPVFWTMNSFNFSEREISLRVLLPF
jgi:hypothetical protein